MDQPNPCGRPNPAAGSFPAAGRIGGFHFTLLACLLAAGAVLRFHQIDARSLSLDEYWALYLATGRGSAIFGQPFGVIINPPPAVGFVGAPRWWHIMAGMDSSTHPPLYHIVLRAWVDLFGDSDLALHSLSALLSLAAVAAMFDLVRLVRGPWPALAAAALVTFAPAQIFFAHVVRPYSLLLLLSLLTSRALFCIAYKGPSPWRLIGVGLGATAMALTHYLSAGPLVALGAFAAIRLRGPARWRLMAALFAALLLVTVIWGPFFWQSRRLFQRERDFLVDPNSGLATTARFIIDVPARLLMTADESIAWPARVSLALLVYIVPLLRVRRSRWILYWWLWIVGSIGFVAVFDLVRHAAMISELRYMSFAAPGIYILAAAPLPTRSRIGMLCPPLVVLCVMICGLDRFRLGDPGQEDWPGISQRIEKSAGPHGLLVFSGPAILPPQFDYIAFKHYAKGSANPVMFLVGPVGVQVRPAPSP